MLHHRQPPPARVARCSSRASQRKALFIVRQLLGHRNVQTTINAYIGLENIHASEIFSKIVMQHLDVDLEAAE